MGIDVVVSGGIEGLGLLFGGLSDGMENAQPILDALPCAVALVNAEGRFLAGRSLSSIACTPK
jgi:6-phosphogluconate dehydrogenase (decarboxylating)